MPLLGVQSQAMLAASMRGAASDALRLNTPRAPRAIILITAHWETEVVTVSSGAHPNLLYDYYGFPPESYEFKYPAPGAPDVADEVAKALKRKGISCELDAFRGWDHGVFVPMMLIHPKADVPIVQVSVLESQDPEALFRMGEALAPLREQNVAIIGSGMAGMHNMPLLVGMNSPEKVLRAKKQHGLWTKAVRDAVNEESVEKRGKSFGKWREWDGAYDAHPRDHADHFSPLVVCAGAAGDGMAKSWVDKASGWEHETFYWDE